MRSEEHTSVNYLILGFVIGMCNGFAIPIAQLFGALNKIIFPHKTTRKSKKEGGWHPVLLKRGVNYTITKQKIKWAAKKNIFSQSSG